MIDAAKTLRDVTRFLSSTRMSRTMWWGEDETQFEESMNDHCMQLAREEEKMLVGVLMLSSTRMQLTFCTGEGVNGNCLAQVRTVTCLMNFTLYLTGLLVGLLLWHMSSRQYSKTQDTRPLAQRLNESGIVVQREKTWYQYGASTIVFASIVY
jgi:nitrogen fixation-related uncharacterized protein